MLLSILRAALLVLALCGARAHGEAPLDAGDTRRVLGAGQVSILRDSAATLRIEDVASPPVQERFGPLQWSGDFGFPAGAIWLRIELQRDAQAPKDWILELASWALDDVRFFAPDAGGFRQEQAGDTFAFAQREVEYRSPAFRVVLPDTRARTFYVRVSSKSSYASRLILWEAAAFRHAVQRETLLLGIVLGLIAMASLLSFSDWLFNRDRVQLSLSGLLALLLLAVVGYTGLVNQYLFPRAPLMGDAMPPITVALFAAWTSTIFRRVLEIGKLFPRLDRVLVACAVLCLVATASRWVGLSWIGIPIVNVMMLIGLAINAAAAFVQWRRGRDGAGLFLLAYGSFTLAFGVILTTAFSLTSWPNALREPSLYAGSVAFALVALIALLVELRSARREREDAQRDAAMVHQLARHEQRLREEQTVFFSFVAHELRTPLGVVRAGLRNLERELGQAGDTVRQRVERLRRSAERMGEMIERHLQLQRLSRADFELTRSPVPPQTPAASALEAIGELFPQRDFKLVNLSGVPDRVPVDDDLIALALANLLSNAAKYSPEGTPVTLTLEASGRMLDYRVHDQGAGIAAQESEMLFQMFTRAVDTRGKAGFGIGLTMARRIAQLHGGTLEHTRPAGGGTVFTLSIPIAAGVQAP